MCMPQVALTAHEDVDRYLTSQNTMSMTPPANREPSSTEQRSAPIRPTPIRPDAGSGVSDIVAHLYFPVKWRIFQLYEKGKSKLRQNLLINEYQFVLLR